MELAVTVCDGGATIASARLTLHRSRMGLRGVVGPVDGVDGSACGLAWRAVVLIADSLRLRELQTTEAAKRGRIFKRIGAGLLYRLGVSDPAASRCTVQTCDNGDVQSGFQTLQPFQVPVAVSG